MATVLCFQHCDKRTNILCYRVPACCPICGLSTEASESRIPPFEVKSPFCRASDQAFVVVIKPTHQNFLDGYEDGADLHIGIATSQGQVYEYDERGITMGSPDWECCVAVPVLSASNRFTLEEIWDKQLSVFAGRPQWTPQWYEESGNNCFDFVLDFLRTLHLEDLKASLFSKSQFCQDLVIPLSAKAGKYITAYNQIKERGYVCVPVDINFSDQNTSYW